MTRELLEAIAELTSTVAPPGMWDVLRGAREPRRSVIHAMSTEDSLQRSFLFAPADLTGQGPIRVGWYARPVRMSTAKPFRTERSPTRSGQNSINHVP